MEPEVEDGDLAEPRWVCPAWSLVKSLSSTVSLVKGSCCWAEAEDSPDRLMRRVGIARARVILTQTMEHPRSLRPQRHAKGELVEGGRSIDRTHSLISCGRIERAKHGCEGSSRPNDGWRQAGQKFPHPCLSCVNLDSPPLRDVQPCYDKILTWLKGYLLKDASRPVASKSLSITPPVHATASRSESRRGIPLETAARLYRSAVVGLSEPQSGASSLSKSKHSLF